MNGDTYRIEYDTNGNLLCYWCGTAMKNDLGVCGEWYCEREFCKSPSALYPNGRR